MNILILTGKFGMGHWSAAQSLRQQLLGSRPDDFLNVLPVRTDMLSIQFIQYKSW